MWVPLHSDSPRERRHLPLLTAAVKEPVVSQSLIQRLGKQIRTNPFQYFSVYDMKFQTTLCLVVLIAFVDVDAARKKKKTAPSVGGANNPDASELMPFG